MVYYSYYNGKQLELSVGGVLRTLPYKEIRIAKLAGNIVVAHLFTRVPLTKTQRQDNFPNLIKDAKDSKKYIGFWEMYDKDKMASLIRIYHTKSGEEYITGTPVMSPKKVTDRTYEIFHTTATEQKARTSFVIRLLSQEHLDEIEKKFEMSGGYDDGSNDGFKDEYRLYNEKGDYVGYLMKCHYTEQGERVIESAFIDGGGEANIYMVDSCSDLTSAHQLVAKIYNNDTRMDDKGKQKILYKAEEGKLRLLQMLFNPKGTHNRVVGLCQPRYILYDKPKNGNCVGFLMTHYNKSITLYDLVTSNKTLRNGYWTRVELVSLAIEILKRFKAIHDKEILMGDVNLKNILVVINEKTHDAQPMFIDVDSYQIGTDKVKYRCKVHRNEFLSPRLQLQKGKNVLTRTLNDEYYAIAVLIFNILFLGRHPYESSRSLIVENQIRERKFLFPLDYEQNKDSLKGAYLRIWRYLPDELRRAFHSTFYQADSNRQFLSPKKWERLLRNYLAELKQNTLPRTIYPKEDEHRYLLEPYVAKFDIRDVDYEKEPQLGQFINEIHRDCQTNYAVIELGATWISLLTPQMFSNKAQMQIRNYVYSVNRDGSLDIGKFLEMTSGYWEDFKLFIKGETPVISHLYLYGGSFLRNLPNRTDVINTIKENLGLNIGIMSAQKEVELLINQQPPIKKDKCLLFVYAGPTSLILATRHKGVNKVYEFGDLGTAVLQNCIFGTSVRNVTRLEAQFDQIDNAINKKLQLTDLPEVEKIFVTVKGTKSSRGELRLPTLEAEHKSLTTSLLTNRPFVSTLFDDIGFNPKKHNISFYMLNQRLVLSIYKGLMKKFGLNMITESVCNYKGIIEDITNV